MDYLAVLFLALGFVMVFLGNLMNYCTSFMPKSLVRFFRYGRANVAGTGVWKLMEVPKSWFGHFYLYAVLLQASAVYTVFKTYQNSDLPENWLSKMLLIVGGSNRPILVSSSTTVLAVILFQFHLIRRLYENCFVSVFSGTKMNAFHYFLAFLHYTGTIFCLVANSPGFASDKATSKDYADAFDFSMKSHIYQIPGVCLFFYANYQQNKAHRGLADLRKGGKDKTVTTNEHKIPRGGMFETVSCPNYWAEILIYIAFAYILNFQNYTWNCCTIWVISNQIASGVMNHHWYKEKFPDTYPKNRKAIIPYIW